MEKTELIQKAKLAEQVLRRYDDMATFMKAVTEQKGVQDAVLHPLKKTFLHLQSLFHLDFL